MSAVVAQSSDRDVIHRYARYAGVAMLLTLVFGALGEPYLPGKILVSGDHERLLNVTQELGGSLLDSLKSTVVHEQRSMGTWVVRKHER